MLRFKRLYRFMLQSFVPLFVMTFLICLFIVLMQFLWRYIDELVGKGLGVGVLAELFFYAALTMVPLALPLAILLASLMTFGNLGERFELTALKAGGVSLLHTMRPLIVLMVFIAIGAFFFQNNVLPVAQAKMWTLLYSVRQKSPELDIPEGAFYDQIPGFNLYVKEKDRETGVLRDLMIYDVSRGFDNTRVILADSGTLSVTPDKTHLYLNLYDGELFENLREATGQTANSRNMPYRREGFTDKQILIAFDANFNRMDESGMRNQYVGKNIDQLQATIDSVAQRIDSIGAINGKALKETPRVGVPAYSTQFINRHPVKIPTPDVTMTEPLVLDSVFGMRGPAIHKSYLNSALVKARRIQQDYKFKSLTVEEDRKVIRRHGIELQKKFTLSLACIVFFFIGAPLGAIIRKGGLGTPLVISVLLFIVYYIIDNTGIKLARDGRLEVWEGVWLSSIVLLPLGIFVTYKAVNDSAVFNADAYRNFFMRLLGRNEVRHLSGKEVIIEDVEPVQAESMLTELTAACRGYIDTYPGAQSYVDYWIHGFDRNRLRGLSVLLEQTVNYLANSRDKLVVAKLNDYPILRSLWLYHPTSYLWTARTAIVLFPIGIPLWLIGLRSQRRLKEELDTIMTVTDAIRRLINKTENNDYDYRQPDDNQT